MHPQNLREVLQSTLEDYRLTRGERRALSAVLDDAAPDLHSLNELRSVAFDLARQAADSVHVDDILGWLEEVTKLLQSRMTPRGDAADRFDASFSPGDACAEHIVGLIRQSRTLDICVFTITDDRISEALLEAHRRRGRIRVITDNGKAGDLGSDIDRLEEEGIPIRRDSSPHHMHHKFAIFDSQQLLTGSYNWTRSAAANNRENFIVTNAQRLVRAFQEHFDSLWREYA